MAHRNLINSVLSCLNPKMCITPSHYVCGNDLALFTSFVQIENCLTCFTNTCKNLTSNKPNCLGAQGSTKI